MDKLELKIKKFSNKYELIKPRDKILIGISGGPDSVCLFFFLMAIKEEMDIDIYCVHVHHGIRGDKADKDMEFCKNLAKKFEVPIDIYKENIPEIAKKDKISLEEAGRNERKRIFNEVRKKYGIDKIALGHHKDDQAETLIMNMCRGTTIKGLSSIEPKTGNIIRPLLSLRRYEIEEYLDRNEIKFVIDETNLEDDYTRNAVRHNIIPKLIEDVNKKAVEHMSEMALYMGEVKKYFLQEAKKIEESIVTKEGEYLEIDTEKLNYLPGILQGEVLLS